MKLKVKKLSKTRHCLEVKDGKDVVALTACYDPKDGPEDILDRLNLIGGDMNYTVTGSGEFGFEITDASGVLLESAERSIYRNTVAHMAIKVIEIVGKEAFTLKK